MSYKINYKIRGDFLRFELSGSYPIEKFREISDDMDKVIDSNGISRVMVDLRNFKERFGVFNGLQHIEKFRPELKTLKFAIVDIPENKQNNSFFENASFNRGYQIFFFYDEKDAQKWLEVEHITKPKIFFVKEY